MLGIRLMWLDMTVSLIQCCVGFMTPTSLHQMTNAYYCGKMVKTTLTGLSKRKLQEEHQYYYQTSSLLQQPPALSWLIPRSILKEKELEN